MLCSRFRISQLVRAAIVVSGAVAHPATGLAQAASTFKVCSQGTVASCAVIQLTSKLGIGPGGTNFFEIAINNLGSQTSPLMPTTIYNAIFSTGQVAAPSGSEIDASVAPTAVGGATLTDATEWDLFDSGDAIFLSALSNNGVGGCAPGSPAGGFSQAGQTCGDREFLTFTFFTTRAYDPAALTLTDLEFVGLTDQSPGDSCNDATPCTISAAPVTATPEPSTIVFAISGFSGLAGLQLHRRRRGKQSSPLVTLAED